MGETVYIRRHRKNGPEMVSPKCQEDGRLDGVEVQNISSWRRSVGSAMWDLSNHVHRTGGRMTTTPLTIAFICALAAILAALSENLLAFGMGIVAFFGWMGVYQRSKLIHSFGVRLDHLIEKYNFTQPE